MIIHIVAAGENIYLIARTYSTSVQRIISDNGLMYPYQIVVGQALIITQPATVHTVKEGETPFSIAIDYGLTVQELYQNNPELASLDHIYPGQILTIDFWGEKTRTVSINGYAYPHVNRYVLRRTLPFLTYLSIFSYGFREDGSLLIPDDEELLDFARTYQALPVLVLTSIDESGAFSSMMTQKMIQDVAFQNSVLDQIIQIMLDKGYRGLDSDFEYIEAEDADGYVALLENLRSRLHAHGMFLHTDLAPKTSANQAGLLYEGHNYAEIGAVSDHVLLMTYEWGYTYGPPMAIAPIDQVRNVLNYAVTEIPDEKIFLGIPNYGYNWRLPYSPNESRAFSLGNQEAVQLAVTHGSEIFYDETAQAPYFNYIRDNTEHTVWFEDVRSIQAKFKLVNDYDLLGAGYWNVMRPFAQNWAFLSTEYNIRKLV